MALGGHALAAGRKPLLAILCLGLLLLVSACAGRAVQQATATQPGQCDPGFLGIEPAVDGQTRESKSRLYYLSYTLRSCRTWQGVAFEGRILPESVDQVIEAFEDQERTSGEGGKRFIMLNSTGGQLVAGLKLAQYMIREDLVALVGPKMICASMCSVVFITAKTRRMHSTARLGIHSASDKDGRPVPEVNRLLARILTAVPGARADTYLELADATPPDEITWLSAAEAEALGFTD
ncbi:MAG: hypothetical protein AAFY02_17825 [Pseudomonadota bacterium]